MSKIIDGCIFQWSNRNAKFLSELFGLRGHLRPFLNNVDMTLLKVLNRLTQWLFLYIERALNRSPTELEMEMDAIRNFALYDVMTSKFSERSL